MRRSAGHAQDMLEFCGFGFLGLGLSGVRVFCFRVFGFRASRFIVSGFRDMQDVGFTDMISHGKH